MGLFEGKLLGSCRIQDGAIIGQDHHWAKWHRDDNEDPIFNAYEFIEREHTLKAPGYGGQPYGNGALFVKPSDVIWLEPIVCPHCKQIIKSD